MINGRIDVKKIRQKLQLSQPEFATKFGFEITTLRNWEQGKRNPTGPSRILLVVIERAPELVHEAIADQLVMPSIF